MIFLIQNFLLLINIIQKFIFKQLKEICTKEIFFIKILPAEYYIFFFSATSQKDRGRSKQKKYIKITGPKKRTGNFEKKFLFQDKTKIVKKFILKFRFLKSFNPKQYILHSDMEF